MVNALEFIPQKVQQAYYQIHQPYHLNIKQKWLANNLWKEINQALLWMPLKQSMLLTCDINKQLQNID